MEEIDMNSEDRTIELHRTMKELPPMQSPKALAELEKVLRLPLEMAIKGVEYDESEDRFLVTIDNGLMVFTTWMTIETCDQFARGFEELKRQHLENKKET